MNWQGGTYAAAILDHWTTCITTCTSPIMDKQKIYKIHCGNTHKNLKCRTQKPKLLSLTKLITDINTDSKDKIIVTGLVYYLPMTSVTYGRNQVQESFVQYTTAITLPKYIL
jgi:hypothetical protein